MDMLITAGERKATALLCMALHDIGIPAASFTGSQAGFLTDGSHMNAKILELRPDPLSEALAAGLTPVAGGSQGVSPDRNVTFHGRVGSVPPARPPAPGLVAHRATLSTPRSRP